MKRVFINENLALLHVKFQYFYRLNQLILLSKSFS
jgi:hypothetical protein